MILSELPKQNLHITAQASTKQSVAQINICQATSPFVNVFFVPSEASDSQIIPPCPLMRPKFASHLDLAVVPIAQSQRHMKQIQFISRKLSSLPVPRSGQLFHPRIRGLRTRDKNDLVLLMIPSSSPKRITINNSMPPKRTFQLSRYKREPPHRLSGS